jgi:hypothetical protein
MLRANVQERKRVQEVSKGIVSDSLPAVQIIPPIMQLYPDVEVQHADDSSAIISRAYSNKWSWVFAGRSLYLVGPPLEHVLRAGDRESIYGLRIMHHRDVYPLLEAYLKETGQNHHQTL